MRLNRWGWLLAIAANAGFLCVLGLYRTTSAEPPGNLQPFANPAEQRQESVEQLKAIQRLLREQNDLLRSGKLRVIVTEEKHA